jgi:hypothetical protein
MALWKDPTYEVRCCAPECDSSERMPYYLLDKPGDWTTQWLTNRAWSTEGDERHLCPVHTLIMSPTTRWAVDGPWAT